MLSDIEGLFVGHYPQPSEAEWKERYIKRALWLLNLEALSSVAWAEHKNDDPERAADTDILASLIGRKS